MTGGTEPPEERDRAYIHCCCGSRQAEKSGVERAGLRFYPRDSLEAGGCTTEQDRMDQMGFVMKFQQTTGPAKGIEDTVFYVCTNRLTSLNEVGGSLDRFSSGSARWIP